jgi:hypothetical protein
MTEVSDIGRTKQAKIDKYILSWPIIRLKEKNQQFVVLVECIYPL